MELSRDIFHGISNEEDECATFCTANTVVRDAGYVMQQGNCLGTGSVELRRKSCIYEQQYLEHD